MNGNLSWITLEHGQVSENTLNLHVLKWNISCKIIICVFWIQIQNNEILQIGYFVLNWFPNVFILHSWNVEWRQWEKQ